MIKWIFLLLLSTAAIAQELQKEYFFTDNTIVSTDLFPKIQKRFELVRIPAGKILYRMDAKVVAKTFELNGIRLDTGKIRFVTFIKKSPVDVTSLKIQLTRVLQERYPTIAIENISIMPHGYLASLPPEANAVFDPSCYLNGNGTFYIIDSDGLRRYFDYSVNATLNVLHTTRKVLRRENLSTANTALKEVPFESFRDTPLTGIPEHPHRFRAVLKQATPIIVRNIEKMPLILKDDNVIVEVRNGSVILELIATATQEGGLYDIITIQKRDGKRSRAKVIGEKRVELQ